MAARSTLSWPASSLSARTHGLHVARGLRRAATLLPIAIIFAGTLSALCRAQAATAQTVQQSTPEGLRLLHLMQHALGGAERMAAVRDYEETVQARTWNPDGSPLGQVRKRTRWMRNPNSIRLDQIGPRDTYVLFYDGAAGSGWEILPDRTGSDALRTTGKVVDLAGGELSFARNYLTGFQLNQWLADRVPGFTVSSPATNVLRIAHGDDATDFTLDPGTRLPLTSSGVSLADPNRPVAFVMHYEAWTTVEGIRFPTRRANYHAGLKLGEITDAAIRVNVGLAQDQLRTKPADFMPGIARP